MTQSPEFLALYLYAFTSWISIQLYFYLISAFLDEAERKYLFECDSEEQCGEWMDSIIKASYEFMRKNLIFYRTEIHRLTGKDPLEQYGISDETRFQVSNGLQLAPSATSSL
ncbi:putative pleckstrin -likey domain-containing family J member 1 isoform 2 [Scophthalmus maximus]|uniref:Putative pleckstrin-likey domain-containing family J member 1 isoform 2 n=1 Tax=Scophthalmus maximus TaxID=52904 RepID=A0A2U9BKZ6_SCOMX|nr:putative pleckstrin -likey domain-containing family J member 1 isoform 2 [Scophthalmus maximus]